MNKGLCVYCGEAKDVRVWDKTDELVCYDCRVDLLDTEFYVKKPEYKSDLFGGIDLSWMTIRKPMKGGETNEAIKRNEKDVHVV